MGVKIRWARPRDAGAIYRIGTTHKAFAVSKRIRFYSRKELKEWTRYERGVVFLVAERGGEIAGFIFVKMLASDWAYFDNFFVLPSYRRQGIGSSLLHEALKKLKKRGVYYVSSLIRPTASNLSYYKEHGFRPAKEYVWVEHFLD